MSYVSRICNVDLTRGVVTPQDLPEEVARNYLGGSGLAAKILWEETTATTHPLSPENVLVIGAGPFSGTAVPLSSRYSVAALSPLTGIWGEAHSGGRWADQLRHAGFDVIVFRGKSPKPVYLFVKEGRAELRDAAHLWGKDTYQVSDILQKEIDPRLSVACIGPAGEKLVPLACVMNDGPAGRAAARTGMGAVMGSKNLKAIAVLGTMKPPVVDEEGLRRSTQPLVRELAQNRPDERTLARFVRYMQTVGNLPIKNWQRGHFESFVQMVETVFHPPKPYFCSKCPVGCMESHVGDRGRELTWEAFAPMGSLCLIDDLESLREGCEICNRWGVDTVSTGSVIAFAMEAYERGDITKEDTDGIELTWGNGPAQVAMIKEIVNARGFGKVLGKGVRDAAKDIGGSASEYALHVKGLDIPAHDPRAFHSLAVAYATNNRGACHVEAHSHPLERRMGDRPYRRAYQELGYADYQDRLSDEGKGVMVAKMQHFIALTNSLATCNTLVHHGGAPISLFAEWLNYITGWGVTPEELQKTGERIFNLKRLVNVRRGITRQDDTLPKRFLSLARPDLGFPDRLPNLETMLQEYYRFRHWDKNGIPSKAKLAELGLPTL